MKITIEINCDNAAFEEQLPGAEAGRILHKAASDMEAYGPRNITLRDMNGNQCGTVTVNDAE